MALDDTAQMHGPAKSGAATAAAVLRQLLALHPVQVTLDGLIREMNGGVLGVDQPDAIAGAVRDLTRAGLLHRNGDLVFPTQAAFLFSELLSD
jgi:hypothetical protein